MACYVVCRSCYNGDPSHKKDSVWAWMVCVAAATNLTFTVGLIYSFGVLLPVLMDYFKENRERTAWIGSLSIAVCLGCGPFAGSLVNRFGCRKVSIYGCLTCALSLTVASFANDLTLLYVSYAVLGARAGCVFLSSLEIVRKCFDKWRSLALGIASTGQGLGTMVLSQVLQTLDSVFTWRNSLRIVAGGLALNRFLGVLYDSKVQTANNNELLSSEDVGQRRTSKRFTCHWSVWKFPSFLVLTITFIFAMFGRAIVYVHLVKYCEDRGMSYSASSRLILFMGIQIVLGRFACGFLCSYKRLNNWYILQAVLLVNGVSTMLLTMAQNYEAFVAYAVIFGFCDGAYATVNNIQAMTCVDQSKAASACGFMLLAGSVTSLTGPPISGLAADKLGSYGPSFHMAGGALVVASLIFCVLRCIKTKQASGEENTEHAQDYKDQSDHNDVRMDGFLTKTKNSNDGKPNAGGNTIFVSTV